MVGKTIYSAIAEQVMLIRAKKGSIALDDLSPILESVAKLVSPDGDTSILDAFLRDEIIKIANHIEATKHEIAALTPESEGGKQMGTAAIQLDAVLKATEEAAQGIMDAADEIQQVAMAAGLDEASKEKLMAATTRIYEACNFQDLTGQRIVKVMQALEFTEQKIRRLTGLFLSDGSINVDELHKVAASREDQHLLNGPQLPGSAPSQDDIDAMFKE
ncbi:MAG TPA: protein phosphatase CheZ [Rickettsiales bacterium]|nr:protein phosphatase CheZ [Rickettsiales bacterium]